ncbi:Rz-like spanin [Erwinia phage Pavtok]|uniref:Putative rz protein n=1 Tax=Erwinia phage Pavtok TaxID=2267655 RepID=A0A345BLY8_9CAUD|nr:Rz-like spanin [Erwinia phage Pavtok]AXF51459.1 putative rz protein [Erwinia phage Pavtok]
MTLLSAKAKAAIAGAVVLVAVAAGAGVTGKILSISHARDVAQLKQQQADERAQWEADKAAITKQAQQDTAAAYARTKAAQDALAALDAEKSQELANAERENNDLRDAVASGDKRVRILAANLAKAQLDSRQQPAGGSGSAGGVGDDQGAELSTEAGRLVLDLRAGIIRKEAQLDYLQNYVLDVVRQCKR